MASIAIVYIGERRFEDMTRKNHEKFLLSLSKKHDYKIYDFTHHIRTWSTQGLCGEQAQILDMHHALAAVKEPVVVKLRTDVWICAWDIDRIMSIIDEILICNVDFVYLGPRVRREDGLIEKKITKLPGDAPKGVHDLVVIFRVDHAMDVPKMLMINPDQSYYDFNKGWWQFARPGSNFSVIDCDIFVVRAHREIPSDVQIAEDWFAHAINVMKGTPVYELNQRHRDRWRERHKTKINENNFL